MAGEVSTCKSCGKEMAKTDKKCPHCGTLNPAWQIKTIVQNGGLNFFLKWVAKIKQGYVLKQSGDNVENMVFCQSCGMPLVKDDDFGTNAEGTKNKDYCAYCYKDGEFTQDVTMEGMIEICVPSMVEVNKDMTAKTARQSMKEWFPTLKRWKTT